MIMSNVSLQPVKQDGWQVVVSTNESTFGISRNVRLQQLFIPMLIKTCIPWVLTVCLPCHFSYFLFIHLNLDTITKTSIYAMAVNPSGKILATGSPDKVCISMSFVVLQHLCRSFVGGTTMGSPIRSTNWKTYRPYRQYSCTIDK